MIGGDAQKGNKLVAEISELVAIGTCDAEKQQEFDALAQSVQIATFPGAILSVPQRNQTTLYYGVCNDTSEWRRLRPLLLAFAGPTVTKFTGFPESLENPTSVEAHLLKQGFHVVARLVPGESPLLGAMTRRSLLRMVQLVSKAPVTNNSIPESTSQLISRFFDALNGNDRIAAAEIIERCRNELRMDALNLTFMQIQLLAHFEDWRAICELPNFESVCHTRKSPAVVNSLLEALYQVKLSSGEDEEEVDNWQFEVRDRARTLLRLPISASAGPGALRLYALEALHAEPRNQALEAEVLARRNAVEDLAVQIERKGRTGYPSLDTQTILEGISVTKVRQAFVEAERVGDLAKIRFAQELFDQLEESTRRDLMRSESFRNLFQTLQAEVGDLVPGNLLEWIEKLSDPEFTTAMPTLERAISDCPAVDLLDPIDISKLAEALISVPESFPSMDRLRDALPLLVAWIARDPGFPRPSMSPIYEGLFYHLVVNARRMGTTYDSAGMLIRSLLSVGLPKQQYDALLDDCLELASGIGVQNIYWLLDVVEETILNASSDPQRRQVFWNEVSTKLLPLFNYLTPGQRTSVVKLTSALGWDEESIEKLYKADKDDRQSKSLKDALAGKTVSIYSLTESALRQAQEALEKISPEVKIWLSHDKGGTPTLKNYAQSSDIFVIATASAKHAATGFIQQNRPNEKMTLFAAGRGFSSILRVIEENLL